MATPADNQDEDLEIVTEGDEVEIEIEAEEGGDKTGDKDADERLSAGNRDQDDGDDRRRNETDDERRERRREEGRARREARRRYAQEDNTIIRDLTNRVQQLSQRLDEAGLEKLESNVQASLTSAERWKREANRLAAIFARAVTDGDGDTAARAQMAQDEAKRNAQWFENDAQQGRRQLEEAKQPQRPQQGQSGTAQDSPEAVEARNREIFFRRNPGFNPKNTDDDTRLMLEIDAEVAAEGFQPHTRAYWDEVERRADEAGLDFSKPRRAPAGDDARRDHHSQRQPREETGKFTSDRRESRGGPPVGGKGGAPTKPTARIPREVVDMIKEAGMWDDIKQRTKMVREYQANLKAGK